MNMISLPRHSTYFVILITYFAIFDSQLVYGNNWHVIEISQLIPKSICTHQFQGDTTRIPLVHRHGPCSPFRNTSKPSYAQILDMDQARVNRIHGLRQESLSKDSIQGSQTIQVPDENGGVLGTGNYMIQVGIGTPADSFWVIFDTGSDVSWVQCTPCVSCYQQQDPLFDPTKSTTYSSLLCNSAECQKLDSDSRNCPLSTSTCQYEVMYGDNSKTEGNFGKDTLTMGSNKVFNFLFGCGNKNTNGFGEVAGLIGLGRGAVSLVSQLSSSFGAFSYCVPSTANSQGYLSIGGGAQGPTGYTQMVTNNLYPSFYFVNLIGIEVGGQLVPVSQTIFSNAGTILDSGTVITRLPPTAYLALRDKFRSFMAGYPMKPGVYENLFDTCYDFSSYKNIKVPKITLKFSGEASLDVDINGILHTLDYSHVCLQFAPNKDDDELGIIGNRQQLKYNIMYDVSNQRIGFSANAC